MKREIKMVAQWVMAVLGIQQFSKDAQGKLFLTGEQRKTLAGKYGEQFVTNFEADMAQLDSTDLSASERQELEEGRRQLAELKERIDALDKANADFKKTIAELEKQPAQQKPQGAAVELNDFEKQLRQAGVDLSLKHNRFLSDYLQGKAMAAYSGDTTIDTQELKQEFGKYVEGNRLEILRSLFGATESTAHMSTIITDKTEVRATQANIIGSVLQQFVPEWTPSGAAKFTPLTIRNFKCKLNVAVKPSDIMEDVLGYLYDEQAQTLQSMPVVRYILQQLILPKLDEERELALAVGEYQESVADGDGKFKASSPLQSMDGYLTQLRRLYDADADAAEGAKLSGVRWLQVDKTVDPAQKNVRQIVDAAVKEVADKYPLYAKKSMKVHIDPVLADAYRREYLEEYKWLKNQDGTHKNDIDFSNFEFAEMEGMRGTGCFFITPKENFKHLVSHNPQNVTLRFLENHYTVDILGEWWEGTGFWLAEAVFAYIKPEA